LAYSARLRALHSFPTRRSSDLSGEHEVSVASAASIVQHLDRSRYEPVPIRIEKDGRWTLADKAPTAISAADVIENARLEAARPRSEEHTSELQSPYDFVCRLLL